MFWIALVLIGSIGDLSKVPKTSSTNATCMAPGG